MRAVEKILLILIYFTLGYVLVSFYAILMAKTDARTSPYEKMLIKRDGRGAVLRYK